MNQQVRLSLLDCLMARAAICWDCFSERFQLAFLSGAGVIGSLGRLLKDVALDNRLFVAVSIVAIAVFSVTFLASVGDFVES